MINDRSGTTKTCSFHMEDGMLAVLIHAIELVRLRTIFIGKCLYFRIQLYVRRRSPQNLRTIYANYMHALSHCVYRP